jgi:hypothetical protein
MCEGWSLEIGNAFRGAVVRQHRIDQPATWLASGEGGSELDGGVMKTFINETVSLTATDYAKRLAATAMYRKGKSFLGAAILLKRNGGDEYVVLHLICQGIEITLKGLLLFKDYEKFRPKLRKYGKSGHDLLLLADDVLAVFRLRPMRAALRAELQALSSLYEGQLLRYGTFHDILVDPHTVASSLVVRRMVAAGRLAERELMRNQI